jgi:hypothetical protein
VVLLSYSWPFLDTPTPYPPSLKIIGRFGLTRAGLTMTRYLASISLDRAAVKRWRRQSPSGIRVQVSLARAKSRPQ